MSRDINLAQAQNAAWVTLTELVEGYGHPAIDNQAAKGIATEILIAMQQDGPLVALVDAWRQRQAEKES